MRTSKIPRYVCTKPSPTGGIPHFNPPSLLPRIFPTCGAAFEVHGINVCVGGGRGGVLAQLNVSRAQKLCSNTHMFCRGQGQMSMCLLGQTGSTGAHSPAGTGSLDGVDDACVAWIPRGSTGSLSKPGNLGGSPGMVMGCLEVAGTRHMALHKSAGLWLEEKEEGWVPSRRRGDGGLCLPL